MTDFHHSTALRRHVLPPHRLLQSVPANLEIMCATLEGWRTCGGIERAVMWMIGEWWNFGERHGERVAIVTGEDWTGPRHQTCRNAGWVTKRWEVPLRQDTLTFEHHKIVASLPDARRC
jgi:hypothetical protein